MAQEVKNPPAMQESQETQVRSLNGEDPLEWEMTTCSSILVWEISWTEEPGCLQSMGTKELDMAGHTCSRYRYYRGENKFSERSSSLPKDTQLGSVSVGGRIRVCLPLGPC